MELICDVTELTTVEGIRQYKGKKQMWMQNVLSIIILKFYYYKLIKSLFHIIFRVGNFLFSRIIVTQISVIADIE